MSSLVEITRNFVGKNFLHCSPSINDGLDCFTLCTEYLKTKGAKFDRDQKFKGEYVFHYKDIYAKDKFATMEMAADFLSSIMAEVKKGYEIAGDILVMRMKKLGKNHPIHFGINAGNDQVIVAIRDQKIKVLQKKLFEVIKVLRWE